MPCEAPVMIATGGEAEPWLTRRGRFRRIKTQPREQPR